MSTGLLFDGVAGSEAIDSSGEKLSVAGADVSDWETPGGIEFNWEHTSVEKGPDTLVGRVVYLKKIFSASDCETDRQRKYWDEVGLPYIYVIGRLADGAGHPGAQAIAALMRDNAANGEPLMLRLSVEGSTLSKEGNVLKESVIKRIAITARPCNRTAITGLLEDPHAPAGFEKKYVKEPVKDLLDIDFEGAQKSDDPLYQPLGAPTELECNPIVEGGLIKALEAGSYNAAPGTLTGGAALQREDLRKKPSARAAELLRRYAAEHESFDKAEFRAFAKMHIPEMSDDFLDHFEGIAQDYHLQRKQLAKAAAPARDVSFDFSRALRAHTLEIRLRKTLDDVQAAALADPRVPQVRALYLLRGGKAHRAGRFVLHNNSLHHLEDYFGLMQRFLPEGPVTDRTLSAIHGLRMSPLLRLATDPIPTGEESTGEEQQADQPQEPPTQSPPRPASVFAYHRAGMDRPHTLEVSGGKYLLDGKALTEPEVRAIVANTRSGAATVRYHQSGGRAPVEAAIAKMEEFFTSLLKSGEPLMPAQDILAYMRAAEDAGHLPKGTSAHATRHMMEDPMVEGIGNKKAWQEFQMKQKPGVYVASDANDFSAVNNAFGHSVGDDAIKTYGKTMRDAMDESGAQGKLFRTGGDEFFMHFPSLEHASKFSRAFQSKLESVPPVGGVHKLSTSLGFGNDPEQADRALYHAKDQKYLPGQEGVPARERKRAFKVGQAPNLAHSLVAGSEGSVPLHDEQAETLRAAAPITTRRQPRPPI